MKVFPLRPTLWAAGASLLTVACGELTSRYSVPSKTSIPVFMLVTIVVAWRAGFRASLTVAVVATLGLDYFYTEPRYSLEVASSRDVFALLSFAATSTLVSHLSHRIRTKSDLLQKAEEQQRLLYEFSRSAFLIDWKESVEEQLCELISGSFHLSGVAILTAERANVVGLGDTAYGAERLQASFRARHNYDLPNHVESMRMLKFGTRCIGALLLRGSVEPVMADSLATIVATQLERIRSVKSEGRAQSQAVSERLRTAVLDGLAHAVKTPLTTIIASSSGLREVGPLTTVQTQLAQTIEEQAEFLSEVTNKLLRTAHLEATDIKVNAKPTTLSEVYTSAVEELRPSQDIARLQLHEQANNRVTLDAELTRLILVQILENALKYSPVGSTVDTTLSKREDAVQISVHNHGTVIPRAEQTLVFERYFRGAATEHKASGTGIGLSAAKHAAEAMGGQITVESSPETGTAFQIILPIEAEEGGVYA